MATRPATAPETMPSTDGLPLPIHSASIQASAAPPVATWVTSMAMPARLPAPTGVRRGGTPRVQVRPDGPVLVRGAGEWMDRDGRVHLLPR